MHTKTSLCECGCGNSAPIAERTHTRYGHVKGQPMRFIRGHATKGKKLSPDHAAKVGAYHRGRPKPAEQRAKMSAAQKGERCHSWKGGVIVREGRRLVLIGKDHPMADFHGYVYEHRLVAAQALGRTLTTTEHVHHIDLNPRNNAAQNLAVLSPTDHRTLHNHIHRGMTPYEALWAVGGSPCAS